MANHQMRQLTRLISSLNEDQIHALYRIIVDRLNLVHKARALSAMRKFHILDRVSFTHNGKYYKGVVTRLNQKTITVTLDDGNRWNVSPGSLTKIQTDNSLKELLTKEQWQKMHKRD